MNKVRLSMTLLGVAALLSGCSGSQPAYTNASGVPVGSPPVAEAVYVSDATSGTVLEASAGTNGQLSAVQTTSDLPGVTQVVPASDGHALFAIQPGSITVLAVDQSGETGNLAVQQTVDTSATIDTPMTAVQDSTGAFLLVAGTHGGATTVAAYPLDGSDNLGSPTSQALSGLSARPATPNGLTAVGLTGSQEAVVLALQTASNNVVGLGFNHGTLSAASGVPATVDAVGATGVTSVGTLVYASGQQAVQVLTVDADGDLSTPTGLSGATSVKAQTQGINTSIEPTSGSLLVGDTAATEGLAAVTLMTDGSLGSVGQVAVVDNSGVEVGVNAVTADPSGIVFTASAGGSADSLILQSVTSPLETTPIEIGGTNPTSICFVTI